MKKCIIILIFLINNFNAKSEEINKEWLNLDYKFFEYFNILLSTEIYTINDINLNKFNKDRNSISDLGFGYKLMFLEAYGGYSRIGISLILKESQVITYRINISSSKNVWIEHVKKYKFYMLNNVVLDSFGLVQDFSTYDKIDEINRNYSANLGQFDKLSIPKKITQDYYFLVNPFNNFDYGTICGVGASKPLGREALENILNYDDPKILENILVSINPVGRIYAIEGLFKNHSWEIKDKNKYSDILEKIYSLKFEIPLCRTCEEQYKVISSPEDLYETLYY
jgi:hypothetical protein